MPSVTTTWWPHPGGFASRLWGGRRYQTAFPASANRIVLFTDPDTLREPGNRDWPQARSVVTTFEDEGIAVVLWGNETRSEMELIQSDLNLHHPFISENGGGLFVRHGYFRSVIGRSIQQYDVVDFGRPYYEVAEALHQVARRHECPVIGFSNMSIDEVADECSLSLAQARLAKLREYDEPFRTVDAEPATHSRVCRALRRVGLRCFTHEAFHHATAVADRTHSIRTLISMYRQAHDGHVLTVGLAKESSETCLLQAVDTPIVIQSDGADTARLSQKVPTARFVSADVPRGWCEAILQIVDGRPAR
jgi:mannosyl-3-phosphoglycerate phosphatase